MHTNLKNSVLCSLAVAGLAGLALASPALGSKGFGYGDPRSTDLHPFTVEATGESSFLLTRRSPGLVLEYANGKLHTIAGGGRTNLGSEPLRAEDVGLYPIDAIADPSGGVLVSDFNSGFVARVRDDRITRLTPGDAHISPSDGLDVADDGSILFTDGATGLGTVRSLAPNGTLTTIAGGTSPSSEDDGVPATTAYLPDLRDVVSQPDGSVLIGNGNRIRRIGTDGIITTFAGSKNPGFAGDGGPASAALFHAISSLDSAPDGSLLVADAGNHRIRRIAPDGTVSTIAGNGEPKGYAADGTPALDASITPASISATPGGAIIFIDGDEGRIREIGTNGELTTLAGMPRSDSCTDNPYSGIQGTDGDDSLKGGSKRDLIRGEGGEDSLNGRGGADCIEAGLGGGLEIGGFGDDTMVVGVNRSGEERDVMKGSSGDDDIFPGRGDDLVDGGPGNDEIEGFYGEDTLLGGPGNDRINGRGDFRTVDVIRCGPGKDIAYADKDDRVDRKTCEKVSHFHP